MVFRYSCSSRPLCVLAFAVAVSACSVRAEDPVFSGPQVGEKLPSLEVHVVASPSSDRGEPGAEGSAESFDPVTNAGDGPVMLIFFHELTRPGFGLTRGVARFAATRAEQGMKSAVIFLTDDPTETRKWTTNVRQHFVDGVTYSISPDGKEGPGSYGLNRNVTLTILVGNDGKVTNNFALVQPQLQSDGPKILEAIAEVTGGGEVPDVADLEPRYAGRDRMQQAKRGRASDGRGAQDSQLTSLLRSVINKQATPDEVRSSAKKVEAYVDENAAAQKELARIVHTVVNSGRISNYGSETAQEILRKWMKAYPHQPKQSAEE